MTKTTLYQLMDKVQELAHLAHTIGYEGVYTAIDPNNKTMKKLMNRLNAKLVNNADGLDVYRYEGRM